MAILVSKNVAMESEAQLSQVTHFAKSLEDICLVQGLFPDVIIRLDDGAVLAHKPMLMARCDMMLAMFSHDDFVESSARVIKFPGKYPRFPSGLQLGLQLVLLLSGVSTFTFQELLFYLYTDHAPRVNASNCAGILEMANRLCLPRLISLVEETVIAKMTLDIKNGGEVIEDALNLLQPSQVRAE